MENVIIYTTPTWPHCTSAKKFLKSQGISYIEKDVSKDQSAQQELVRFGARGVPTFIIGNEVAIGFDQARILSLVNFKIIECPECRSKLRIPKNKGTLMITCKQCSHKFKVKS